MNGASAREVALWAGLSAFFGNVVGLKLLELISGEEIAQLAVGVVVSGFVAAAVYSKERLASARAHRNGNGRR